MELIPYDIQEAKTKGKESFAVSKDTLHQSVISVSGKTYDKIKWTEYWWFDTKTEALAKLKEKLEKALESVNKQIEEETN